MRRIILLGIISSFIALGCQPEKSSQDIVKKTKTEPKDSVQAHTDNTHRVERDLFGMAIDSMNVSDHEVQRNESLYLILDKLDFDPQEIYSITQEAQDVIDVSKLRPGQRYRTYASADSGSGIARMVWQPNPVEYVVFDWQKESFEVYRASRLLSKERVVASGEIETSLYQTVKEAGSSQLLAYKMADIFAWQIDFFTLRQGDSFKALYNRRYIDDQFLGIGEVMAAEFTHRGETFKAYKFSNKQIDGYYTEEGESVEKALLKAPFKFNQRVSSGFSRNRYHPTLKRNKPHTGTDYAAPRGTPILAVGDGRVTEAQYRGANGNIVQIKHNGTYRTAYLHLSGFADGIYRGASVKQGQIIGYVGTTGRSTGPHLHYSLYKNDRPVNSLAVDLPSSESVPDSLMDQFKKVRNSLDEQLQAKQDSISVDESVITRAD